MPGVNFYLLRVPTIHESRDRCVRCHVTTGAKYRCAPYSIGGSKEFNGRAPILPPHRQIREESAETYQKQQITYQSKQIWLQPYQSSMPGRRKLIRPYFQRVQHPFCVKQHEEYGANHCPTRISGECLFSGNVSRSDPFGLLHASDAGIQRQ